jgi:hypothetical protein
MKLFAFKENIGNVQSNAVKYYHHLNFVWDLLGGTVGMAVSPNDEAVAKAEAEMKKAAQ